MGIVAIGDSLINADRSWAYWLGLALGQPLHRVSVDGSLSRDVVDQLPPLAGQRYAVACLSVGGNDVMFGWDADEFADNLATIVAAATASAERVVVQTISLGLASFPGSAAAFRRDARQANSIIRECGALVLAGDDLRGPRHLGADRIHPTLAGQLDAGGPGGCAPVSHPAAVVAVRRAARGAPARPTTGVTADQVPGGSSSAHSVARSTGGRGPSPPPRGRPRARTGQARRPGSDGSAHAARTPQAGS